MTRPIPIDLTIVGKRCVYLNDYRIAGGKPYVSENLPQHSFEVTVEDILAAMPMLTRKIDDDTNELVARSLIVPLGYHVDTDWERVWVGNITDDIASGSLKHLCMTLTAAIIAEIRKLPKEQGT